MNHCFFTISSVLFLSATLQAADRIDFNRDVRPILSENCFQCHGPDANQRKANLRLDIREEAIRERKSGSPIVPQHPSKSTLIERLVSEDETEIMPPPETGKKITPAQMEILKQWIDQGAEYKRHWAFLPPEKTTLPKVQNAKWVRNPIDAFILARLEKEGWTPAPEADRRTWIRRVTLDLTGLPATVPEVETFLKDSSPNAYEKVVDRLLASPRYGERMALEWLDAARYADTHGYHIDSGRDMTKWRDYVIESFNSNLPFDQFTIEQLAGDLLPNATLRQKIASGFNRNHMINFEGGAIPEEYLTAYIVDRVNTTGTVWMGLTVACAQCHDHKYDPFTQKDFYRLYAYFHNLPENGLDGRKGNATPLVKVPTPEQARKQSDLQSKIARWEESLKDPNNRLLNLEQKLWEQKNYQPGQAWKSVVTTKQTVESKANLKVLEDQSILAEEADNPQVTYTVSFMSVSPITAIKLDVLADDKLPAKGPGKAHNGNFVLTDVDVLMAGRNEPIALKSVSADFSQAEYPVEGLLKKNGRGWAILPQVGKSHYAIFELAQPIQETNREVTLKFHFRSVFPQHQFGRFRLSTTDVKNPHQRKELPDNIKAILTFQPETRTDKQVQLVRDYFRRNVSELGGKTLNQLLDFRQQLTELEKQIPDAMIMQELPKPRDTFMLMRGQYDKKGEKVTAGTPDWLPALPKEFPNNRLGFAKWLMLPNHPLTARVIVNRYWQMYFGTGLVKTSEDFGSQGEWPSHPDLLDWLAVEFRESGWNVKHMQRLIVLSATYRQSSTWKPEQVQRDPENRLLARMTRLRLPAEFIRDQALAVSGLLHGPIGGASVSPYQPEGIWEELAFRLDNKEFSAQIYQQSKGTDLYRRTMYTFWKRTAPPPSLITLDAPDRETCTVRRSRTNTPLQALVLMNDPTYVEASRKWAERILKEGGTTFEDQLRLAYQQLFARKPTDQEIEILRRSYHRHREKFQATPESAEKLLKVGESLRDANLDTTELATWTMIANALLNLDETVTRN